jgi:hypothetical protein
MIKTTLKKKVYYAIDEMKQQIRHKGNVHHCTIYNERRSDGTRRIKFLFRNFRSSRVSNEQFINELGLDLSLLKKFTDEIVISKVEGFYFILKPEWFSKEEREFTKRWLELKKAKKKFNETYRS